MIENERNTRTDDSPLTNFPKGIAILSYQDSYNAGSTIYNGQIVLTKVESPIEFNKGQRLGELNIIGRNTPVFHAMGGRGLTYPEVHFDLKDDSQYDIIDGIAHQNVLAIAGWCDAGVPLFFMFDKWRRRVVNESFKFEEIKYHTWYQCVLVLKKYVPIEPLAYQRKLVDLAPYPELPVPTNPGGGSSDGKPGQGSGTGDIINPSNPPNEDGGWFTVEWQDDGVQNSISAAQKEDGNIDCIEHVITSADKFDFLQDIAYKFFKNAPTNDLGSIGFLIQRINQEKRNINIFHLFERMRNEGLDIDSIPEKQRTICIPRKVKYTSNGTEKTVNASG